MMAAILAGCGTNPNQVANMPGPVQQVLDTPTLTGNDIGTNMLKVTGNQALIGTGRMPGYYSFGPAEPQPAQTYYVDFEIPMNFAGLDRRLGYDPKPVESTTQPTLDYVDISPLNNLAGDRVYYNPNTHYAPFAFKLMPNGTVVDESWNAVTVNS
jgi:hypothetical protein